MNHVGILYEPTLLEHCSVNDHVEQPSRISAIYQALIEHQLVPHQTLAIRGQFATEEQITAVHNPSYLAALAAKLESHPIARPSDPDMYANQYTLDCARLAAGSSIQLVKHILADQCQSGLALVRPPGHHACSYSEAGFCYLNNVMIAAIDALKQQPNLRVWIVDIDVHLGDGTIELINKLSKRNPNSYGPDHLRYFSVHRHDRGRFYPNKPALGATTKSLTGQIVNVGFDGPQGDQFYRNVFDTDVLNAGMNFQPDLILVSAGFDAARGDPLGQCDVTPAGYRHMIATLQSIQPRVAMILEGGYHLSAISKSAVACIQQLISLNN